VPFPPVSAQNAIVPASSTLQLLAFWVG